MTQHDQLHRRHEADHPHAHGPDCGHEQIGHAGHTDYAHDGHLHHDHDDHIDDHWLPEDDSTPAVCTPEHTCAAHTSDHTHDERCDHPVVPHGEHADFVVGGHLHHPHEDHCDNHGSVLVA